MRKVTTTGPFFVGRARPETETLTDGTFRLTLRVVDNQGVIAGRECKEAFLAKWHGPAAANWFAEHGHQLTPGRPLDLELHNLRAVLGRLGAPEIHAVIVRCSLAPLAPSHVAHANNNPQAAQPA
jgi:hypothetical protein